jgi:hypothetical protein
MAARATMSELSGFLRGRFRPVFAAVLGMLLLLAAGCRVTTIRIETRVPESGAAQRTVTVATTDKEKSAALPKTLAVRSDLKDAEVTWGESAGKVVRSLSGGGPGELIYTAKSHPDRRITHDVELIARDYVLFRVWYYSERFRWFQTLSELIDGFGVLRKVLPETAKKVLVERFAERYDTSRLSAWIGEHLPPLIDEVAASYLFSFAAGSVWAREYALDYDGEPPDFLEPQSLILFDMVRRELKLDVLDPDGLGEKLAGEFVPRLLRETLRPKEAEGGGESASEVELTAEELAFLKDQSVWRKAFEEALERAGAGGGTAVFPLDFLIQEETLRFDVSVELPGWVVRTDGRVRERPGEGSTRSLVEWRFNADDMFPFMSQTAICMAFLPDAAAIQSLIPKREQPLDAQQQLDLCKRLFTVLEGLPAAERAEAVALLRRAREAGSLDLLRSASSAAGQELAEILGSVAAQETPAS